MNSLNIKHIEYNSTLYTKYLYVELMFVYLNFDCDKFHQMLLKLKNIKSQLHIYSNVNDLLSQNIAPLSIIARAIKYCV